MPNNLYLLADTDAGEAAVIDPSLESDAALALAREWQQKGIKLVGIWNTHGHFDHVYDNALWKQEFQVPITMHDDDLFWVERLREQSLWLGFPPPEVVMPDQSLQDGQTLTLGSHEIQVIHVPGHSPGSVAFWIPSNNVCIDGDVLFHDSVGRTDLPGCSTPQLMDSLRRLVTTLPRQTKILPGHGDLTTIETELQSNPFLQEIAQGLSD